MNQPKTYRLKDISGRHYTAYSSDIIEAAQHCIRESFATGKALTSPRDATQYCQVLLAGKDKEVFYAIWLNTQHQVVKAEELASGTLGSAQVYPREVIKAGLACNAAAVIFAHNHPSGSSEPSIADKEITKRLSKALSLIDIRVLDHFIVARDTTSFAELGLL